MTANRREGNMVAHNAQCTCWNCPVIDLTGKVDFRACGQSREIFTQGQGDESEAYIVAECKRRPELGLFDPMSITFKECPEWKPTPYGYLLKNMRVMILGIDGYLGWTLALWLGNLGCEVSGVDNFSRRDWVKERGAHTVVPISRMTERLHAAIEVLGINMNFRQMDILKERDKLRGSLFEGMFPANAVLHWDDREWSLGGELTPRDPGSFYHVSKVQDTYNVYEACKYWWLRSYDVMQGVIYGVNTPQVATDTRLRTRLDIDEWFGTVINRFVAQAVIGFPLTMYGAGEQIRGFIGLEDAMQCMTQLITHPPEPGQYDVVNQMSGFYSINHLAHTVAKVASKEFAIPVVIQRVENPRVESDIHPFEPIYNKLSDQLGFKPKVTLEDEIYRMLELLTQPHIKERIEEKKHLILPRTWWSGMKKQVETLEVLEEIKYEPSSTAYRP